MSDIDYVFAHIPRTGGKTLGNIIRTYSPTTIFYHHFHDSLEMYNHYLKDSDNKIVSILRDPIARTISEWVSYGACERAAGMTIETYVRKYKNTQCKFLLGMWPYENNISMPRNDTTIEVTVEDFNKLKHLIDSDRLVLSLLEDWKIDKVYHLLHIIKDESTLHPGNNDGQLVHIWKKVRDGITIDDKLKQLIQENNQFDILLYNYANNSL
jgi:hypothetical protein